MMWSERLIDGYSGHKIFAKNIWGHLNMEAADSIQQYQAMVASQPRVMVEVWEQGCHYCAALAPYVPGIASKYRGRVAIMQIERFSHPNIMSNLGVKGYPTIISYVNGREVHRYADSNSASMDAEAARLSSY